MKNWRNYIYSNFFIIILFNLFSNRSFLNINQYPIFPSLLLTIKNLENSKKLINRDLSKSINFYKFNNKIKIKFFDNISHKKLIIDLLKNIPPFNINNNNIIISNNNDYKILDILELIPENYSIPLNSINSNNSNNFYSLEYLTNLLESNRTSDQLHIWLNYIFGIYQKGKKSNYYLSNYSNESYLDNKSNNKKFHYSLNKENIYKGFVPIQIIDNKEISERVKKYRIENLFFIKNKKDFKNNFNKINKFYCIKCSKEKDYILLGKNVLSIKLSKKKKYYLSSVYLQKFNTNLNYSFYNKKNYKFNNIAIDNHNNYIFIGGINNHILFINLEKIKNNNKNLNEENCPINDDNNNLENDNNNNNIYYNIKISYNSQKYNLITSLIIIEYLNKYLISGDIYGTIIIFQINIDNNNNNILKLRNIFFSLHSYEITSLNYNNDLNLLASSSIDGQINFFSFPQGTIIFSLKLSFPIDNIFLFNFSIPSFIIYSKQKEKIFSYSLNGVLLKELDEKTFINPICYYCNNESSNIIYINNENSIKIINVPFFNKEKIKEITFDYDIISFDILNSNNIIYILTKNGEKIIKIYK